MFTHHPLRKLAYLDSTTRILPNRPMEISSKGLTQDSGQKLSFFPLLLLNKIGLEIMFPDHPVRKQAYLD